MAQLRREKNRFDTAGLRVVLVGMGSSAESEQFRLQLRVPFPLLCDPQQELYRLVSLPRGAAGQVLGPGVLLRGVGSMLKGHVGGKPVGDVLQLPGTVGVDTAGTVWFAHTGTTAADYAGVDTMLAVWDQHLARVASHGADAD